MVSVDEVAKSAVAALERGQAGMEYPIVSHNLTWVEFIGGIQKHLGKPKPVFTLPNWLVRLGAWFLEANLRRKGKESGLDPVAFVDLQTRNTFMDTEFSSTRLGYPHGNLNQALKETVEFCSRQAYRP